MKYHIQFLESARHDLNDIISHYQFVAPHVISPLRQELGFIREQLQMFPYAYVLVTPSVRRCPLRRFPYHLYYRIFSSRIDVIAILPQMLEPENIAKRLS